MDNPVEYVLVGDGDHPENWSKFSNLDWGKAEAIKNAETLGTTQIIYKLVPVYQASTLVTTSVITKEFV